jgi:hypothetical protein
MKKTFFIITTFCLLNVTQSSCSDGIPQAKFDRANNRAFTMQLEALQNGEFDPNKQPNSGGTFLHCAIADVVKTGSSVGLKFLRALVTHKADLNKTTGFTFGGKQQQTGTAIQMAQAMLKRQPKCTTLDAIISILKQEPKTG